MEHHNQSFFGQKTGLILDSAGIADPWIFVLCLKKKETGQWEKPSANEGKKIKINLLEIIAIVDVLKHEGKWGTVHKFQEEQTQIIIEQQQGLIKLQIGGYLKTFKFPESTFFLMLLEHILEEKICNATSGNHAKSEKLEPLRKAEKLENSETIEFIPTMTTEHSNSIPMMETEEVSENTEDFENPFESSNAMKQKSSVKISELNPESSLKPADWFKSLKGNNEFVLVPGEILATRDKSLNFQVLNGKSIWIPISQTQGSSEASTLGGLWIQKWLVTKKLSDIFPMELQKSPGFFMEAPSQ